MRATIGGIAAVVAFSRRGTSEVSRVILVSASVVLEFKMAGGVPAIVPLDMRRFTFSALAASELF